MKTLYYLCITKLKTAMSKNNFTFEENRMLTEIYRRLNYFKKGDLDANILLLEIPSMAKSIVKIGLIKPYSKETPRAYNWYNLTEKGKKFFSNYLDVIDDNTNSELFNGVVKIFDKTIV